MKVRFEEAGKLIEEVSFPHAELPIGEELLRTVRGVRVRYRVISVEMLAEGGELKALVTLETMAS